MSRSARHALQVLAALTLVGVAGCEPQDNSVDAGDPAGSDAGDPDTTDAEVGLDAALVDAGFPGDAGTDAGLDCGPHGDAHGDHCHCFAGYVERDRRCVAIDECMGEDPYEPDDRPRDAVPWMGEPMERWLCPGDRDHVTIDFEAGDTLIVRVYFEHDEVDIDLALWAPGADPRFDGPVARAVSRDDDETLTYVATRSGAHLVRVHSPDRGAQGAYRFEAEIVASAD